MKTRNLLIILSCLSISAVSLFVVSNLLLPHFVWNNEPVHAVVEANGALAALFIAVILLRRQYADSEERLFWIAVGLLSMGLLQGFHAFVKLGRGLILLHSLSCLSGAFCFALAWLPESRRAASVRKWVPWTVAAGSVLLGAWTVLFRETMPLMMENGRFTRAAMLLNLCAGIIFLVAAGRFILDFHRSGKTSFSIFSCMALLFGLANLFFPLSAPYDTTWWFWHLLRVVAYLMALWLVIDTDLKMSFSLRTALAEREKSEAALSDKTQRLQLATESAKLGVWDWDVVNNTMVWDDRMLELYGLTRETFPGGVEAWQNGLHPEDRDKTMKECEDALRGEKEWDTEFRVLRPDGTVRHIRANGIVIRNAGGSPIRMLGINHDITERKEAEKNREIMVHELKAALANIKTLNDMLPICASCKKIRDDKGYWSQVETYISTHTDTMFSHALCPDCAKKAFDEIKEYKNKPKT